MAVPTAMTSWIDDGARSIAAAVVAGLIGVAMTALLVLIYSRFRLPRLVRAAERMADGELGVAVGSRPSGGGLEGRLARALHRLSEAIVETTSTRRVARGSQTCWTAPCTMSA